MATIRELRRYGRGQLPGIVDGGYPMLYLDRDNSVLCAPCANTPREHGDPFRPTSGDTFMEGSPLSCDGCSMMIESAYGDPDAPDGE